MNRFDAYYRQAVTSSEVDGWFDAAEQADQAIAGALGLSGLCQGGAVTEKAGTPNLSVDVSGPMVAYDASGNRIAIGAVTNVPVNVDENSASTTVVTVGHERYLSVFVTFARSLTDPRLDGNGDTVFYDRAESYTIEVVQAASAPLSTASRPALRAGSVLLADIKLINGQTSVLNADIYTDRTQYVFVLTGTPKSVQARTAEVAMQLLEDQINDIINGVVTIAAAFVTFTPAGTIAATNVQAALAELGNEKAQLNTTVNFTDVTTTSAAFSRRVNSGSAVSKSVAGTPDWNQSTAVRATAAASLGQLYYDLTPELNHGDVITAVTVGVKPVSARAPGDRMYFTLAAVGADGSVSTLTTTAEDDGTTNAQRLTTGAVSFTVDLSQYAYVVTLVAGNVAGAGDWAYDAAIVGTRTKLT